MNLRYSELKYNGEIYTEQWKIDEILIDNKFNWMVNAEIKNARLEIFKDTLVWNGGIWYNGDWHFGVWRDGEWRYGNWQNGVWYSGVWKNGTFKSGIIYNGKFFKGKIEGGEIRGGVFINTEIAPNVVEYTTDEYQAKKEEEQQPIETPTTVVAQSNQPIGQVRVNGTKPASQVQAQPQMQQERLITKFKIFESFNFFKKKIKPEIKPEIDRTPGETSVTAKLIDYLEQDTINNLHDFGYSEANKKNIYTNDIYAFHFKNRLEKRLGKHQGTDFIINHMIQNIKGFEDYIINKDINKYNL